MLDGDAHLSTLWERELRIDVGPVFPFDFDFAGEQKTVRIVITSFYGLLTTEDLVPHLLGNTYH
jgi:hypothetical protein